MENRKNDRLDRCTYLQRYSEFMWVLGALSISLAVSLSASAQSVARPPATLTYNSEDDRVVALESGQIHIAFTESDFFVDEFTVGEISPTINRADMEAGWDAFIAAAEGQIASDFDFNENGFPDREEMGCFGELHEAGLLSPGVAEAFAANRVSVDIIDGSLEAYVPGFDLVAGYYTTIIGDGEGVFTQGVVQIIDSYSAAVGAGGVDGDPQTSNPDATGQTYLADNGFDSSLADAVEMDVLECLVPCELVFPPTIALIGMSSVIAECGDAYADAGAMASDVCDGDLTTEIVTTNSVNTNVPGAYAVLYNVVDSAGNAAIEVIRTVTVVDTIPPVITLIGSPSVTVECLDAYTDGGATAIDICDGELTPGIVTTNPTLTNVPGAYTVRYNVADSAGNSAVEVTRSVTVVDTMPPTITILGDNPATVNRGTVYADAGATASDGCTLDLGMLSAMGTVDTSTTGSYILTYKVVDSSGNVAQATRIVHVGGRFGCSAGGMSTASPIIALGAALGDVFTLGAVLVALAIFGRRRRVRVAGVSEALRRG